MPDFVPIFNFIPLCYYRRTSVKKKFLSQELPNLSFSLCEWEHTLKKQWAYHLSPHELFYLNIRLVQNILVEFNRLLNRFNEIFLNLLAQLIRVL